MTWFSLKTSTVNLPTLQEVIKNRVFKRRNEISWRKQSWPKLDENDQIIINPEDQLYRIPASRFGNDAFNLYYDKQRLNHAREEYRLVCGSIPAQHREKFKSLNIPRRIVHWRSWPANRLLVSRPLIHREMNGNPANADIRMTCGQYDECPGRCWISRRNYRYKSAAT